MNAYSILYTKVTIDWILLVSSLSRLWRWIIWHD